MATFKDIFLAYYREVDENGEPVEDSAADVIAHARGLDAVTSYRLSRNIAALEKANQMYTEERNKLIEALGRTEDEDGNEVPAHIPPDDFDTIAAFNERMAELMEVEVVDVKWYPVKVSKINADIPPYVFNRLDWLFEYDAEA